MVLWAAVHETQATEALVGFKKDKEKFLAKSQSAGLQNVERRPSRKSV
jgi:hypothetical protein